MSAPAGVTALAGVAGWAVEALVASALLMALVLAVRGPVRRAFGPQVGYALWLLPLLRLALPPLPAAWREAAATPIGRAGETITVLVVAPSTPVTDAGGGAPALLGCIPLLLAVLWAVGAAGFLAWHLLGHARFCRRIVADAATVEERDGIRLVTSAAAPGPLAFGLWRRYVAFPIDFAERYDADERALALAHEIGHHQRGDLFANWAALGVLALHWFNPLAWRAFRAFRADQELANDARVLAGRSPVDRHVYACAIVKAAHGGAVSAACHLHTITDLKGRLRMLSLSPASRRRLASGTATVAALVVGGLGLTASGSSAAAIGDRVQEAVAQAAPVPAFPPVPSTPDLVEKAGTAMPTVSVTKVRKTSRVVVVKDGRTHTYDGADADAYVKAHPELPVLPRTPEAGNRSRMVLSLPTDPSTRIEVQEIPAVKQAECGIGTGKPASMVIDSGKGEKRMIVVCTDRIRQVTADAMVTAGNARDIERNAYTHALAGLVDARARMVANADMSDADRTRALTAIDTSITEMKGQLARFH